MSKVKVAIIGLGFGAEFIPIYQRHPDAELYAICQRNEKTMNEIGDAFGGFRHGLKEIILGGAHPEAGRLRTGAVHQTLAYRSGHTDGHIFEHATKPAHHMPLEVRQVDHKVIIGQMRTNDHFLEMFTTLNRQAHGPVGFHDVNRGNGREAMIFHHLLMCRCR